MTQMLIMNDLHLSVKRKAGTTPASQEALRGFLFDSLRATLDSSNVTHMLVNGDLMDDFDCETRDFVEAYQVFASWLAKGNRLTLVAGNHDWVSRGDKVSSFEALGAVLKGGHPNSVVVVGINETTLVAPGVMALAHYANQDLFDAALEAVLAQAGTYQTLLLHCNLDNPFAQRSDHSLDLSEAMARKFKDAGVSILLAHEHNSRVVGNVTVLGCQFPTSVSDCIESPEKFAHILNAEGLQRITTWSKDADNGYAEVNWRELGDYMGPAGFIRVAGDALGSEAADVINAIAKFRGRSEAFVITNATKIDGVAQTEDLPESFEAVKTFDVVAFIHKNLDERERKAFDTLLEKSQ